MRELFNETKFKTVRNTMLCDSVLPPKGRLIELCKKEYGLDHASLRLTGIPVHKDRVVLAIYIAELTKGSVSADRK